MKNQMNISVIIILLFSAFFGCSGDLSQQSSVFEKRVEKVRIDNKLPALAVLVFSSDSVFDMIFTGYKKLNSNEKISKSNRFHLGSNTKAFIGFVAASLVEDSLINWDTRFFDICPEYKNDAKPAYYDITLNQLLRHQAGTISKDREFSEIMLPNMANDSVLTRSTLFKFVLSIDRSESGFQYSNMGYVMATEMLERVSGQSWKELIKSRLFEPLSIEGYFGWPALQDTNQTWGHYNHQETGEMLPHSPSDVYHLSRLGLGPAGDMNISAENYIPFLQDNLKGYNGNGGILSKSSYEQIFSSTIYGLGWGYINSVHGHYNVSSHSGSGGTFYCQTLLFKDDDLGIVVFTNCYPPNPKGIFVSLVNDILDNLITD